MIYKRSQTENKEKKLIHHDFFKPVSNNANSSSPFNAAVI